jgi:catechol 2,3-dioxygenase-like lactoylglutathione lyase family enzyme
MVLMKGDTTTMAEDAAKERSMQIEGLDHLVLTVGDVGRTRDFYERVLGMEAVVFGEGRHALVFGAQKINLHEAGREFEPKAALPIPGSADLCFLTNTPMAEVVEHLGANGVEILEGPVRRTGATGPLLSVYCRDPDQNLIEVSNRLGGDQPACASTRKAPKRKSSKNAATSEAPIPRAVFASESALGMNFGEFRHYEVCRNRERRSSQILPSTSLGE